MKITFIILFYFLSTDISANNFSGGYDLGGFIPDGNGAYGTIYFWKNVKDDFPNVNINPISGIMFLSSSFNRTGRYHDRTEIFGKVNRFDDRDDGIKTKSELNGIAAVSRISIKNIEFMLHYGYGTLKKNSYQALYDNSEILGNNGYYYIDSYIPSKKYRGTFYGFKYNYYFKNLWKDFFIGIGFNWNDISEVKSNLIKLDFGFILNRPL